MFLGVEESSFNRGLQKGRRGSDGAVSAAAGGGGLTGLTDTSVCAEDGSDHVTPE